MSNKNIIFVKAFSKRIALKGGAPPNFYEYAWKRAEELVKDNPDLCIVPDIETGYPCVMTEAKRKQMADLFESFMPKAQHVSPGKVFFFGTGGPMEKNTSFEDLWDI